MIRALALALGLAAPALAATPEVPEEPEAEYSSAAVAGVFPALPPGAAGYPVDILLKMRVKLGGAPVEAPAPEKAPADDGH